ncbi:DUF4349 domain-containing protein [Cellulomonas sp. zg-ZUI222]|uniref:DUF4349 domain-containing protein n=1 Tax=Cellulomonas wangleii TaxID=2816956 RepID=A0ABX8D191_9CELL|nr:MULTISPECIES: DUF4349 domain-containing protein [Cellulomonas]MBO0901996.1 DUF4349 domain-containing protein [Cellulomonas sp. zg-ZUI22]MBO0922852.1 DUF4349 domain-containing protein [Cellulomonas wangleii]MBO0925241.1 DUF4349 domain-containing protein [Cellulomonas wangleii]QVI61253.1 DUF4349 domain-containing protein [Cellulomonas wangleii]
MRCTASPSQARRASGSSPAPARCSPTGSRCPRRTSIYAPERAPAVEEGPATFLDGLDTGWTAFVATVRGVLVVVGVLLPWLVVAGLATAAVPLWRRRRTVELATSASDGTTPPDGPGTLGRAPRRPEGPCRGHVGRS